MKKFLYGSKAKAIVLAIICTLVLSACGSGGKSTTNGGTSSPAAQLASPGKESPKPNSGAKAEIRFSTWYGPGDIEIWKEVIDRFQADNPNITVKFEPIQWGEYWQKIPTQLAGQSAPDVIGMSVGIVYGYVEKNQLEPMDGFLKTSTHKLDELPASLAAEGQWPKDKPSQYALPWHFTGGALFGNMTAFKEAGIAYPEKGWTIDEFEAAAQKLTNANRYGFLVPGFTMNAGLLGAYGAEPTTADRLHSNYNAPEVLAYKTWLHDMIFKKKIAPNPKDIDGKVDPFIAGKVAMTVAGAWNFPEYRKIQNFDWDILPMPTKDGKSKTYAGPDLLSIPAVSKNKDAAWKFIEYAVFNPKAQELLRKTGVPMLMKDIQDPKVIAEIANQKPAHINIFLQGAVTNGIGYAFTKKFAEIATLENNADVKIMQNENVDIKKELDDLHDKVNKELAKQ